MTRLAIALLHTALALDTTSGDGALVLAQARANLAWELHFYGRVSDGSTALLAVGVLGVAFGLTHLIGTWAWVAGRTWGGWIVLLASSMIAVATPWPVTVLVLTTAVLVALDLMVLAHRAAGDPPTR